jgi:hypothetical protein
MTKKRRTRRRRKMMMKMVARKMTIFEVVMMKDEVLKEELGQFLFDKSLPAPKVPTSICVFLLPYLSLKKQKLRKREVKKKKQLSIGVEQVLRNYLMMQVLNHYYCCCC